jgi:predicted enzyme related to lactoylglutathione lyase
MSTHLVAVVIDAADPAATARWWSQALGWPISLEAEDEVIVEPIGTNLEDKVPALVFVPVPEAKAAKNRVHLDLASDSIEDQTAIVEGLLAAGATRADIGQTHDESWIVLADPDGNEFCVLLGHGDGGPLSAICLDVVDHRAQAAFWVAASGWRIVDQDDEGTILASPSSRRPTLDLFQVPEAHTVKNRVHLDVAPPKDADQAAEVARLLALGATEVDIGQTGDESFVVLADPEGNEFCVLSSREIPGLRPSGS